MLDGLVAKQVLALQRRPPARPSAASTHFLAGAAADGRLRDAVAPRPQGRHLAAAEHLAGELGRGARDRRGAREPLPRRGRRRARRARTPTAIRGLARETLADAGRRALSLALGAEARRYFEHAAELADEEPERARLLDEAGAAAARTADRDAAQTLLAEAIAMLDAAGRDGGRGPHAGAAGRRADRGHRLEPAPS